ncbi:Chaperone protein DnaK [Maioricimonas rarisocia]|uniref:Chaperone protein DnaK n=1 Tax=Maioricimonas rarisocia TaxID=2528026 RepID=A0A517Z646_9PLAN|nr:Hsp70 family protein [Maioricimonas rarisocia]QDU37924.1 Chaperone protein DnaK [Maioricimonas rarisocia]
MNAPRSSRTIHAVGIDLGTTYSCLSYLNSQGQPITLPNDEGELATPSVVLFDDDAVVVGTEALRNSISHPERVIQNAKRYMGDPRKFWVVGGRTWRPPDVATLVIQKLLQGARPILGNIEHAVITVPAQFSDVQRQQTAEAGRRAGLKRVDIINEPVAAALCHVLSEGIWFAEIANEQSVMVFDLGGGTFDLSLVKYNKDRVRVVASGGDLNLGGIDWNRAIEEFACDRFFQEASLDPRLDRESMQAVATEAEQTKRSLSVRPRASLVINHAGRRKSYLLTVEQFEKLTRTLVERLEQITVRTLKQNRMGWAHVDSVLITGGASRMPMVRKMLKRISGTTLNTSLSPDQSISHGAAYYAGMLLSGEKFAKSFLSKDATARLARFKQQSVNARDLGILVRDVKTNYRVPHYLIPANTQLPCDARQTFGTVIPNQKRVQLHIVESGTSPEEPFVRLGACVIEELAPNLPEGSPIEVTIRYDDQARVHVSAKDVNSGTIAKATIVRQESLLKLPPEEQQKLEAGMPISRPPEPAAESAADVAAPRKKPAAAPQSRLIPTPDSPRAKRPAGTPAPRKAPAPEKKAAAEKRPETRKRTVPQPPKVRAVPPPPASLLESAEQPIPLCNDCGEPLDYKGRCTSCGKAAAVPRSSASGQGQQAARPRKRKKPVTEPARKVQLPSDDSEIVDLEAKKAARRARAASGKPTSRPTKRRKQ